MIDVVIAVVIAVLVCLAIAYRVRLGGSPACSGCAEARGCKGKGTGVCPAAAVTVERAEAAAEAARVAEPTAGAQQLAEAPTIKKASKHGGCCH